MTKRGPFEAIAHAIGLGTHEEPGAHEQAPRVVGEPLAVRGSDDAYARAAGRQVERPSDDRRGVDRDARRITVDWKTDYDA